MYKSILKTIEAYDTIVIHRHIQPDLDAYGAQFGLREIILENFEGKTVYVVGDDSDLDFLGSMDSIPDGVYEGALAIVVDVAGSDRVSDQRFKLAKETMVIDHHRNGTDFADHFHSDPTQIATCQILTDLCMQEGLKVSKDAATYLFAGLVTDSGRFMYPQTSTLTFKAAAFLSENGAEIQWVYDNLYVEEIHFKKLKGYFINAFEMTEHHVAYMKNDKRLKDRFNVSTFTISRGMVNQMANINGIPIWANFTEDDEGKILCELRSKEESIVHIAKKFGGGGHDLACGCTVYDWKDTDKILHELDTIAERL
ncbi:MAG: DHH family phosphoesterase [Candidatus Izemoplasmataceae bacterium]